MSDIQPTKSQAPRPTGSLKKNQSRFGLIDPIESILRISIRTSKTEQFIHQFINELKKFLDCILVSFYIKQDDDTLKLIEIETDLPQRDSYLKTTIPANSLEPITQVAKLEQSILISDIENDENKYLMGVLHPKAFSTFTVPVILNESLYGIIDMQSTNENNITRNDVPYINTVIKLFGIFLGNQITRERIQFPLEVLMNYYVATSQIFNAKSKPEIHEGLRKAFEKSSFVMGLFTLNKNNFILDSLFDPFGTSFDQTLQGFSISSGNTIEKVQNKDLLLVTDLPAQTEFGDLLSFFIRRECQSLALIPIKPHTNIDEILVVASRSSTPITKDQIKSFTELINVYEKRLSIDQITQLTQDQISHLRLLENVSQKIGKNKGLENLHNTFTKEIQKFYGEEIDILFSKSDRERKNISFDLCLQDGKSSNLEAQPLGDDLISFLCAKEEPLLLNSELDSVLESHPLTIKGSKHPISIISIPYPGTDNGSRMFTLISNGNVTFNELDLGTMTIIGNLVSKILIQFEQETNLEKISRQAQNTLNWQRELAEIARTLSSYKTHNEALSTLPKLLNLAGLSKKISTFAPSSESGFRLLGSSGLSEKHFETIGANEKSVINDTALNVRPLLIKDYSSEKTIPVNSDALSGLTIPIVFGEKLYGILNLEDDKTSNFSDTDLDLYLILASNIGSIFSSIDLVTQVQKQVAQQQQLYDATERIRRSLDMESILKISAEEIAKLIDAKQTKIEVKLEEDQAPLDLDEGVSA